MRASMIDMDVLLINMDDYIPIFCFFRFYYILLYKYREPKTKRVHCLRIAHVCFDCMFGNAHAHMSQYVQRKMHDKKMTTGSYTWEYFYGSEFKSRRSRCSI